MDSPTDPEAAGYTAIGGKSSEWVIIDSNGRDRFGHKGETVIPGAGTNWQHLHRLTRREKEERDARRARGEPDPAPDAAVATGDDEDELPWQVREPLLCCRDSFVSLDFPVVAMTKAVQNMISWILCTVWLGNIVDGLQCGTEKSTTWQVIFIGDESMVERLRHGHRYYQHTIQQALGGGTCEHRPGGCQEEECPFTMPAVLEAEEAFEQGNYAEAAELYSAERAKGCADCPKEGEYRKYPKWREATLRLHQARSLRRARQLDSALDVLDPVMHT